MQTYQDIKQSLIDAGFKVSSTGKKFFEPAVYFLAHGEYESPDYTIVKKDGRWVIRQERFFHKGTLNVESVRYGHIVRYSEIDGEGCVFVFEPFCEPS